MSDEFKNREIGTIVLEDNKALEKAHKSYGNSWKARGGVGAFMMLARKWDRLENAVKKQSYDIFKAIQDDKRAEGIMDDIRDLRRYLILVESEFAGQVKEVQKDAPDHECGHAMFEKGCRFCTKKLRTRCRECKAELGTRHLNKCSMNSHHDVYHTDLPHEHPNQEE